MHLSFVTSTHYCTPAAPLYCSNCTANCTTTSTSTTTSTVPAPQDQDQDGTHHGLCVLVGCPYVQSSYNVCNYASVIECVPRPLSLCRKKGRQRGGVSRYRGLQYNAIKGQVQDRSIHPPAHARPAAIESRHHHHTPSVTLLPHLHLYRKVVGWHSGARRLNAGLEFGGPIRRSKTSNGPNGSLGRDGYN